MLSFLLAPVGLTILIALLPDGTPWWVAPLVLLVVAGAIGQRARHAGMGVAAGTLVWLGVLVWITTVVE